MTARLYGRTAESIPGTAARVADHLTGGVELHEPACRTLVTVPVLERGQDVSARQPHKAAGWLNGPAPRRIR
jgi:hypothetical protein